MKTPRAVPTTSRAARTRLRKNRTDARIHDKVHIDQSVIDRKAGKADDAPEEQARGAMSIQPKDIVAAIRLVAAHKR